MYAPASSMNPAELLQELRRTAGQTAAFNEIAKTLTSTLELREVLVRVMDQVSKVLHPGNWSLLLHDEKTNELRFELAVGEGAEKLLGLRMKSTEGIAGRAFTLGTIQAIDDVRDDS